VNTRVLLVGLVVALLGTALYLFVIRGDESGKDAERPATADTATGTAAPSRDLPPTHASTTPSAPSTAGDAPAGPGTEHALDPETQKGYDLEDGTQVRDHRSGGAKPYVRPSLPHPSQSPVTAAVTATAMGLVRTPVLRCLRSVPSSAFGDKPVVMVRAVIAIDQAGTLTVDELGPAVSDIDEGASAAALDCIRSAAGSLSTHVDHPPVESATLAFPIEPQQYR
jgi:hypothetical protein